MSKTSPITLAPVDDGPDLLTGLEGHWKLDESSGTTASDSSSNSHDGSFVSAPVWKPSDGAVDGSLQFDGVDDYVQCGDVMDMSSDDFSVSFWMKADATLNDGTGGGRAVQKRGTGGPGTQAGWQIAFYRDGSNVKLGNTIWDDGANYHRIGDGTPGPYETTAMVIGMVDTWIHVVSLFDAVNNNWKFYIDNVKVVDVDTNGIGSVSNSRGLTFGASDVSLTQFFKGCLDDIRIYDRLLDTTQIKALYDIGDV